MGCANVTDDSRASALYIVALAPLQRMIRLETMKWQWILIGFIILTMLASALLAKPVQVGLKTAALILDFGVSRKWNTNAIPRGILMSEVTYSCGNRAIAANLYRPDDQGRHSGIVLAHGAMENGKDDLALRLAGKSLARAGYVTLVPQLENLSRFRLHQDDIETLVTSFQYLSRQKFINDRVGMMGGCLSAPLVLLAAEEPSISQDIAVITSWGGYYNIRDWVQAVITEYYTYQGETKRWKPRIVLAEEVAKWLIELLPSSSDQVYIGEMLRGSSLGSARGSLSASGQAMYELLANRDPERVGDLWTRLDPKTQRTLASLSPHLKIDQLQTKIAIIHTFVDDAIPSVESRKLAQAIEDENKVYFRIFYQFSHVNVEGLLKVRISNLHNIISEAAGFYLYIYHVLYQL